MSFFGWFGGGSTQEAAKPKQTAEPKGGGGGFFSSITNAFGWGDKAPAPPAAPPPPTTAPTHDPAPKASQDVTKDAGKTQDPKAATDPNNPPPAGVKTEEKPVDPKMVRDSANKLFKAMDGWGTDEDALLGALRGKSAAEVAAIKAEYQDHFGRSLDDDIKGELGGKDLKEAEACLKADPVESAVAALDNAANGGLFGMGTDEGKIQSVLEGIKDPAQRKQVVEAYQKKTGTSLDDMLKSEMSGNDLSLSQALLEGDSNKANAVRLDEAMNGGFLGMGTDEDAVYKALEGCKDENERKALAAAYQKKTGETLQGALGREFSGAEKDVADNLLKGDKSAADAARVKVAADDFWGTDEEAIFKSMEGKSKEEREKLIAEYNRQYGGKGGQSFDQMLKNEMGGLDLEKANQLKDSGKISDEFALKYATDGLGTNEELIRKTLEGKSKTDIDNLRKVYKEKYGQDLDKLLGSECSGRDGFEIGQMLKGKPETPQEMIDRANEAYEFDRGSGSNWFSRGFTDLFSNSGEVLDYQHQRINAIAGQKGKDGSFTEEQKARLGTLTEYQGQDVQNYQAAKDSATNALATGTAVVVGAVVSIASAGTASPAVVAALSALLGGASSMAVKGVMQEGGYALEDIGIDALTTLASAASAGLIKLPGIDSQLNKLVGIADPKNATLMQTMLKGGLSGTLKGGIDSTAAGLMNEANYQGDFGDFLKGMGSQVGTGMAGGFLSGSAAAGTGHAMGNGPQGANPYAWAAFKGGVSGMAGGAAQNAINPAAYSGRPEDIAKQWLTVVGQSGLTGALDSVADARAEIKKTAKQSAQQPADQGPDEAATSSQKPTEAEATPEGKKTAPTSDAADDVSDVKAKVDAEAQGGKQQVSPEQEAAKQKTVAEAEKVVAATDQDLVDGKVKATPQAVEEQAAKKPLTAQEAFDLAEQANYQPKKGQEPDPVQLKAAAEAKAQLAERLPELLAAQGEARLAHGDDAQALQTRRQSFETALALSPEVEAAVRPTLDMMCEKAFDYISRMHGDSLETKVGKLGMDASSGLAGAVGQDPNTMLDVLTSGNVRERAIALSKFNEMMAMDAVMPGGLERLRQTFGTDAQGGPAVQFGGDDLGRLEAQMALFQTKAKNQAALDLLAQDPTNKDLQKQVVKDFLAAKALDSQHAGFADAKGQNMDTKLPSLPAEVVQAAMGDRDVQAGTSLTGTGEGSALSRTTMTIEQAQAAGIQLSPRELEAAKQNGGVLPWNVGTVANMVKPSADFVQDATQSAMPLKAGISGTTFRFMTGAEMLGADPAMARLAAMSQLIGIEAHSFHEIASAAQGFQTPTSSYDPSLPYSPASTGLSEQQLMAIMMRNGYLPSDLNQPAPTSTPSPTHEAE
ncbi:MAG TPA: hypothetical protein PKI03_17330 [Pseudomonadota bacterium]|nr:hypothetical protein [Pseudomonadota bacterium]